MAKIHQTAVAQLTQAGVIRLTFGGDVVEVTTEAAERLAQDIQRALSGLGQNPASP